MILILLGLFICCSSFCDEQSFRQVAPSPINLLETEIKIKPDKSAKEVTVPKVEDKEQKPVASGTKTKSDKSVKEVTAPKADDKTEQKPKKGWQSFFSNKTINNMTFSELEAEEENLMKAGNKTSALKYLEKMVPLCNDLDKLKSIMLELAQLYFEAGNFEKAGKMYNEFTVLYPGCDEAEFALYQAILSSFKLTLDAEHDQTKTQEAKDLALAFLERESFKTYCKEVKDILNKCEERLFEADQKIFNFYLNTGNYSGQYGNAKKHLALIKESYLDKEIPDIAVRIAKLEADFTAATMPVSATSTDVAQAQEPKKKSFKNRF